MVLDKGQKQCVTVKLNLINNSYDRTTDLNVRTDGKSHFGREENDDQEDC